MDPFNLIVTAYNRIQLVISGVFGQIPGKLIQGGCGFLGMNLGPFLLPLGRRVLA